MVSFVLALSKAHVLALNTAHVLRLNKADVLALNKAHVLRLNKAMYVFAISSEIFDTLRGVYWYLHFQVDILRGVFDSCDAEVPRELHILE